MRFFGGYVLFEVMVYDIGIDIGKDIGVTFFNFVQ